MNYDSEDLKQFSPVVAALMEPFDDSEISTNQEGFRYVDPEKYRRRLHKVFKNGFFFHLEEVQVGNTAVTGYGHFIGEIDGVKFDIRPFAMEKFQLGAAKIKKGDEWVDNPNAGKPQKQDLAMQMLASALLKAISREVGLGLHLYQKEAKQGSNGGGNSGGQRSSGNSNGGGNNDGVWTGEVEIKSGKNAGKKWKEVPDSTIDFLCDKLDTPNELALKERARRKAANSANAQSNVNSRADDLPDDDIPF